MKLNNLEIPRIFLAWIFFISREHKLTIYSKILTLVIALTYQVAVTKKLDFPNNFTNFHASTGK